MPESAVITILAWQSSIRLANESGENPPKTTQCTAPMRAHANMAMAASGTIGIYNTTRSPLPIPFFFNTLAKRQVSSCNDSKEIILCRDE